jgi:hypothetical protein
MTDALTKLVVEKELITPKAPLMQNQKRLSEEDWCPPSCAPEDYCLSTLRKSERNRSQ